MPDRPTLRAGEGRDAATIILDDPAWRRAMPDVARWAARAAAAGGGAATVMLSSDRAVRQLNRRYRGIDKPTNVLTFGDDATDQGGDIVLAFATLQREARAARRPLRDHLAHLVVHATLHLRGQDHADVAQARRMEMTEARILHRLGVPNPWKPR